MQCSHSHWLNWGHSFLLPKCAPRKLLVHLSMCLFGNIILYRWIGDTACLLLWPWRGTSSWKCVWCIRAHRRQVVRGAPNVLFVIYLHMRSFKNTVKTGPAKTRPARPLATAMCVHKSCTMSSLHFWMADLQAQRRCLPIFLAQGRSVEGNQGQPLLCSDDGDG